MARLAQTEILSPFDVSGERPHAPRGGVSTWASVLRTLFGTIGRWIARANRRDPLPDLNDHVLRDIGVSPIEAGRAKPRMSHEGWIARSAPPR
jgi:uncharacterized protein YjiS (DUF1127 family)